MEDGEAELGCDRRGEGSRKSAVSTLVQLNYRRSPSASEGFYVVSDARCDAREHLNNRDEQASQ